MFKIIFAYRFGQRTLKGCEALHKPERRAMVMDNSNIEYRHIQKVFKERTFNKQKSRL
jgi:hypothetical protein